MLPIERVMPLIQHDDPLVVELAMMHLKQVRHPEPPTGQFVLEAVRAGRTKLSKWLDDFTVTPDVLDFAIGAIEDPSTDKDAFWPYSVITRAPDSLFTADVIDRVERLKLPIDWVREATQRRIEMLDWASERLQARFLEACAEANEARTAMSQHHEIGALTDRLFQRPEAIEWALRQLEDRFEAEGDWTEIWLVALLRQARHRRAVELAFEEYLDLDYEDNEALAEEYAFALNELCEPDDLPRIVKLLKDADDDHRTGIIEALGRQRWPEAEPLLLDVAERDAELRHRTFAVTGLCEMLADNDEALAMVADVVDREAFDIDYLDLESLAIPLGIAVGKPFPQADRWRQRLEDPRQREQARERLREQRYPGFKQMLTAIEKLTKRRAATPLLIDDASAADPLELTVSPLVRARHVGRNDPCPCGSGKKYKKCCLNKLDTADALD